jgi:hypothetical protein
VVAARTGSERHSTFRIFQGWKEMLLNRHGSLPLASYAVLAQQPLDAPQADAVLFGHLAGCGTRPVKIDHDPKVL